jgi:hypothetical protein
MTRNALRALAILTVNIAATLGWGLPSLQDSRALNIRLMSWDLLLRLRITNCCLLPQCSIEDPQGKLRDEKRKASKLKSKL